MSSSGTLDQRPRPTRTEIQQWCTGRYRSPMEDFPGFLRARSKIRVTTYIPAVSLDGEGVAYGSGSSSGEEADTEELAEDGRMKSTLLPPLEKETSFARPPRRGANQTSFSEEFPDGKTVKRVSVEMDRKIVTHLKRHLNKRMQKRFDNLADHFDHQSDGESARDRINKGKAQQNGFSREKTIFTSYSETGEKIKDGVNDSSKISRKSSRQGQRSAASSAKNDKSRQSSASTRMSAGAGQVNGNATPEKASRSEDKAFSKPTPLPGIPRDSNTMRGFRRTSVKSQDGQGIEVEEVELTRLSDLLDLEDQEEEVYQDFRQTSVSPIQTPSARRPETRDEHRLSDAERLTHMLAGHVHRICPSDKTVVYLYIASGFSDTEAERSFMQEHLYPRLRRHFSQRGHELRVVDLHWGNKNALSDDHRVLDLMKREIDKAHDSALGVNFVLLLGQKYGQNLLPSEVPQDEFEAVCNAALTYRDSQRAVLRSKMADIEQARAEREKTKVLLDDVDSVATSMEPGSDDVPMSARTDQTKEDTEEDSPPIREARRQQNEANKMEQQALRMLREVEDQLPDLDLMNKWYVMDSNSAPPVYRLQNISMVFKDILRNDFAKRTSAKSGWQTVTSKIQQTFQRFAPLVLRDEAAVRRYSSSALDVEVEHVLDVAVSDEQTCLMVRTLDGIRSRLDDDAIEDYVDLTEDRQSQLDEEAWDKVQAMRQYLIQEKISEHHTTSFLIDWKAGGLRTAVNREHFVYCDRVCKAISELVTRKLAENSLECERSLFKDDTTLEVAEHVRCCHEKARWFQGRKDILTVIKSYIKSNSRLPLVVHGKTGSGKSAIMGKTAKEIYRWFKGSDQTPRVLVRMLGCTMPSTNVRTMLYTVCTQLCHIYGNNPADVPSDYKGIFNDLSCRIGQASESRPLVILLDAVDRLSVLSQQTSTMGENCNGCHQNFLPMSTS